MEDPILRNMDASVWTTLMCHPTLANQILYHALELKLRAHTAPLKPYAFAGGGLLQHSATEGLQSLSRPDNSVSQSQGSMRSSSVGQGAAYYQPHPPRGKGLGSNRNGFGLGRNVRPGGKQSAAALSLKQLWAGVGADSQAVR